MSDDKIQFIKKRNYHSIVKDKVVRLRYALFEQGKDDTLAYRDDLYYLHGGYGGAFPKVELELEGLGVDAKVEVELTPEEAYGPIDPNGMLQVPLEEIPAEAQHVGAQLDAEGPNGERVSFTVTDVGDGVATVDANHPLAGKHLRFVLEVLDIRDATQAELDAGYAFSITPEE